MVPPPDDEHDCGWKAYAKAQEQKLAELKEKLAALERRFLEKKSEKRKRGSKLPPPLPPKKNPVAAAEARARTQEFQSRLDTEIVPVPVPDAERPGRVDAELGDVDEGSKVPDRLQDPVAGPSQLSLDLKGKPRDEPITRPLDEFAMDGLDRQRRDPVEAGEEHLDVLSQVVAIDKARRARDVTHPEHAPVPVDGQ